MKIPTPDFNDPDNTCLTGHNVLLILQKICQLYTPDTDSRLNAILAIRGRNHREREKVFAHELIFYPDFVSKNLSSLLAIKKRKKRKESKKDQFIYSGLIYNQGAENIQ